MADEGLPGANDTTDACRDPRSTSDNRLLLNEAGIDMP